MEKNTPKIESHDERAILQGCLLLMQSLVGDFKEYLKELEDSGWLNMDEDVERPPFSTRYPNTFLARALFLLETNHNTGANACEKCRELGIEDDQDIVFTTDDERRYYFE